MNPSQSVILDSLLFDLFQTLRESGMELTLEQYDLLRQAVDQGYGLGGWQDLKRVCRLLWVKPCANYDEKLFDRTFNRYVQQHHDKMPVKRSSPQKRDKTPSTQPSDNLPRIPPRRSPSTQLTGEVQVPVAIQTQPVSQPFQDARASFHLRPINFPIQLQDVQIAWKSLRKSLPVGFETELDVEATLSRIEREGIFSDVVLRPVRGRRTELLLLIDDSPAMVPYFPAFEPFIQAIEEARITPAQIYRFTSYPDDYLYHWNRPSKAEPLTNLLPKLNRHRTIVLILSDAGAATVTYAIERIEGMSKFLTILAPCIRQLIWLNPLPSPRWEQTSAWAIDVALNGKMLTYEPASLRTAAREQLAEIIINTWQLYSNQAAEKI